MLARLSQSAGRSFPEASHQKVNPWGGDEGKDNLFHPVIAHEVLGHHPEQGDNCAYYYEDSDYCEQNSLCHCYDAVTRPFAIYSTPLSPRWSHGASLFSALYGLDFRFITEQLSLPIHVSMPHRIVPETYL